MKPLNPKQERFAHEYLIDLDAQAAAIRAGYSERRAAATGCELLRRPDVQEIIRAGADRVHKQCEVDAAYVLAGAKRMFERCMQEEPVLDHDGNPTGEYRFDSAGAGKALKLLGDHVAVNAFKGTDDGGNPIDQNWVVKIVDANPNITKKT